MPFFPPSTTSMSRSGIIPFFLVNFPKCLSQTSYLHIPLTALKFCDPHREKKSVYCKKLNSESLCLNGSLSWFTYSWWRGLWVPLMGNICVWYGGSSEMLGGGGGKWASLHLLWCAVLQCLLFLLEVAHVIYASAYCRDERRVCGGRSSALICCVQSGSRSDIKCFSSHVSVQRSQYSWL